jgi:glycerol-3-phosphate cytidylyltransferase
MKLPQGSDYHGNGQYYGKMKGSVGFTCSCFDLLHAGHILMLKDAKAQCDKLIVGLQTDPTLDRPEKNKPIQSHKERYIQLEAVKYVDDIFVYDTEDDLYQLLRLVKPDVRILGSDYKDKSFTGDDLNIPIYYHERNHDYSTSLLRYKILETDK